jgi:hypothetical protein
MLNLPSASEVFRIAYRQFGGDAVGRFVTEIDFAIHDVANLSAIVDAIDSAREWKSLSCFKKAEIGSVSKETSKDYV